MYSLQLTAPFFATGEAAPKTIEELINIQKNRPAKWKQFAKKIIRSGLKLTGSSAALLHGSVCSGTGFETVSKRAEQHWLGGVDDASGTRVELHIVHISNFFDVGGLGGLSEAKLVSNALQYVTCVQDSNAPAGAFSCMYRH